MAEDVMLLHGGTEKHYLILNYFFSDQKKWKGFDFGSKMFLTVRPTQSLMKKPIFSESGKYFYNGHKERFCPSL